MTVQTTSYHFGRSLAPHQIALIHGMRRCRARWSQITRIDLIRAITRRKIRCLQSRFPLLLHDPDPLRSPRPANINNWFIAWFTSISILRFTRHVRSSHAYTPRLGRHTARFIAAIAVTTSLCNCIGVPSKRYRRGSSCKRDRKSLNPGSRRFDRFAQIPPSIPLFSSPPCEIERISDSFSYFFFFSFSFARFGSRWGKNIRVKLFGCSIIHHLRREIFKREPIWVKFFFFSLFFSIVIK